MTTSTRRAYINFQLGSGWEDISHLTKYDSFSVSTRAFNDTFHYAQNECQLDILYDATIWNNILSTRTPILLRIISSADDAMLTTENNVVITAESAFALAAEQEVFFPVFYGHIAPETSWSYNGLTSNSIMSLTATDELDTLDVPCGDILYANYAICDPVNPTASIVHALLDEIGWNTSYVDPSVTISTVIPRFSPPDPDSTVLEVLDTLLYEYGYTLNMSVSGQVLPLKWNRASTDLAEWEFTDANCIKEVVTRDSYKDYDGISVIYYALKLAPQVLVYRDDNCGYEDDGDFEGYPIPAGYSYPPETNVIDEITGLPTVVYQEYDDTGIKYKTNKAIVEGMDYNYKAFSSDFSAIVATENHFLSYRKSDGIALLDTPEFYNTKARVVWNNPTGDSNLRLYYNNVYADVWYKSTEREATIDIVVDPLHPFSYTSNYIFDKTHGDNLAKGLAKQYVDRSQTHTVTSESFFPVGSLVNLILSNGTNQACLIMSCDFSESTGLYSYQLTRTSTAVMPLTAQTTTAISAIDIAYTFPAVTNAVTTHIVSNTAPRYRGRYYENHPMGLSFGDWWVVYHEGTDAGLPQRGVWWNNSGAYERVTTSSDMSEQAKFVEALTDVAWVEEQGTYGVASDYGIQTLFQSLGVVTAFIQNLFAQDITASGSITGARLRSFSDLGVNRHLTEIYDEKLSWLNAPEGGGELIKARMGRFNNDGPVIMDGVFVSAIGGSRTSALTSVATALTTGGGGSSIIEDASGVTWVAYCTSGGIYERSIINGVVGSASLIVANGSFRPVYYCGPDGVLRIGYIYPPDNYKLYEKVKTGGTWGTNTLVSSYGISYFCYITDIDGVLCCYHSAGGNSIVVMRHVNGTWTQGTSITLSNFPVFMSVVRMADDSLLMVYCDSNLPNTVYCTKRVNGVWGASYDTGIADINTLCLSAKMASGAVMMGRRPAYTSGITGGIVLSLYDGTSFSTPTIHLPETFNVYPFYNMPATALKSSGDIIVSVTKVLNSGGTSYDSQMYTFYQYTQIGAGVTSDTVSGTTRRMDFSNGVRLTFPVAGGAVTASIL